MPRFRANPDQAWGRYDPKTIASLEFQYSITGVSELRESIRADFAELRQEMHAGFARLESNLLKWSFVFWVGAVAAIAALAGVLR